MYEWQYAYTIYTYSKKDSAGYSDGVDYMLHELSNATKIMVDYVGTHKYFKRAALTQGLHITDADINDAYDIAYGMGIEFEWR